MDEKTHYCKISTIHNSNQKRKHFVIQLTNDMKHVYNENYKTVLEKKKQETLKKWKKIFPACGLEEYQQNATLIKAI